MRYYVLIIFLIFLAGCSGNKTSQYVEYIDQSTSIPKNISLAIKVESFDTPPFYGQVDYDNLDVNHGQMTYIGATPATFAGSILAHALIVGAAGDSKKKAEQEKANRVLDPYKETIATFNASELIENSVTRLPRDAISFTAWSTEGLYPWVIHSYPVFFLSQDKSTLILKNAITIYKEDNQEKPAYQNLVEVVSSPLYGGEGYISVESINDRGTELFIDSLAIMKAELSEKHPTENKEMTLSFYSGGKKVYERGTVISQSCDRMTFRTLRGRVKSVPTIERGVSRPCLDS
ncbi:hypothetical protein ACJJIK_15000 [Microbulbifer sp. ZKSA006]|uniref:hypothetical protein n=1 Tax=Microbulbifer sp. ZKSA006 TaxID=3243390 RepID=UPI004039BF96